MNPLDPSPWFNLSEPLALRNMKSLIDAQSCTVAASCEYVGKRFHIKTIHGPTVAPGDGGRQPRDMVLMTNCIIVGATDRHIVALRHNPATADSVIPDNPA